VYENKWCISINLFMRIVVFCLGGLIHSFAHTTINKAPQNSDLTNRNFFCLIVLEARSLLRAIKKNLFHASSLASNKITYMPHCDNVYYHFNHCHGSEISSKNVISYYPSVLFIVVPKILITVIEPKI
jgi:hypothetical protein